MVAVRSAHAENNGVASHRTNLDVVAHCRQVSRYKGFDHKHAPDHQALRDGVETLLLTLGGHETKKRIVSNEYKCKRSPWQIIDHVAERCSHGASWIFRSEHLQHGIAAIDAVYLLWRYLSGEWQRNPTGADTQFKHRQFRELRGKASQVGNRGVDVGHVLVPVVVYISKRIAVRGALKSVHRCQNDAVNAWAGIESAAEISDGTDRAATPGSHPPLSVCRGSEAHNSAASQVMRLRRQQRPVLGSLDSAGAVLARHARVVLVGSAAVLLPGLVLNVVATGLAFDRYQSLSGSVTSLPELFGAGRASSGIESVLWYLGTVINSLATALVGGYVTTLVLQRQFALVVSARPALSALVRRLPSLIFAWLIGHSWIVAGAWIIGHASAWSGLALFLGAPIAFALIVHTALVSAAIVCEGLGPFAALRRSWQLARRQFSVVSGFVLASAILGLFVQYGITILPKALDAVGLVSFGRFGWVVQGIAAQLGRLISVPLVALATSMLYLEVRMKIEGLDLVIDAERSFGSNLA